MIGALLRPFRARMAASMLAGAGSALAGIGLTMTSGWLIARAGQRPAIADLMVLFVAVRFFALARPSLRYLERVLSHDLTFRILAQLRVQVYRWIEPLAPAWLVGQRSGDLLARLVADVDTLQHVYLRVIVPFGVASITCGGTLVWMAWWSPKLAGAIAALMLLAGVAVPLGSFLAGRSPSTAQARARVALTRASVETLQGLDDLVVYAGREGVAAAWLAPHEVLLRAQGRHAWIGAVHSTLLGAITHAAPVLALLLLLPEVEKGALEGVALSMLVLGAMASFETLEPLGPALQFLGQARESARRIEAIGRERPAVSPPANPVLPEPGHIGIRFEEVSFSYVPGNPVLDHVSFVVQPGEVLGIVGPSGAGKSTIAYLAQRFLDPDSGKVVIGGVDARSWDLDRLRAEIVVVAQDTHVFAASLADNLRLAKPDATDDELREAARRARLTCVESWPEGLEAQVGERGARLSAGERQRVAIARAFLRGGRILLLDEPTANLDPGTEREVMESLEALMRGRTTIVITHRAAALRDVDRIVALENGRVVEEGTPAALAARPGWFRRWLDLQRRVAA